MVMKALVTEDGTATLTMNGEENVLYLEDAEAARTAVIATAAAVASDAGTAQLLELADPHGSEALRVSADGSVEHTSVTAAADPDGTDASSPAPAAPPAAAAETNDEPEAGTNVAQETPSGAPAPNRWRRAATTRSAPPVAANPFLAPPVEVPPVEELERDPIMGDSVSMSGIQDVTGLAAALPTTPPAPPAPVITERTLWVVGVCGGAGVSTIAALAGDDVLDGSESDPAGGRVVLVAPTHAAGLAAAVTMAHRLAAGELDYEVLGLVLVHDRPKLSRATIGAARGAGRLYPRSWAVPYMPAWREPNVIPDLTESTRLRRTLRSITQLTARGHHGKENS